MINAQSFRLATDLPIDDTTSMTFRFKNGMSACFAILDATARTMRLPIFGTKGWLELRDESPLVFQPMDGSLETIDYPLFDKERAELGVFADAVDRKSTYPMSDAEIIHGIKVFEAIVKSAGGASTVIIE
jgi:predicted dehydrogenase